tara:strand:- start:1194 stop:1955 length:762 start_codon:yes stop_codon:yes gene_type:complete
MVLHNGLFELPLELRFQIYHELVMSCLNDNRGSDVSGLFFACRQIYQEMEEEVISEARRVFQVMHDWKTLQPSIGSLELQFANEGSFTEAIRVTAVSVPTTVFMAHGSKFSDFEVYRRTIQCLRSAFRLSCHTLRIHLLESTEDFSMHFCFSKLIWDLHTFHDGHLAFGQAARLVVQGETDNDSIEFIGRELLNGLQDREQYPPKSKSPFREICHTWIARGTEPRSSAEEWMLGYDFEEGLPMPEGIVAQTDL